MTTNQPNPEALAPEKQTTGGSYFVSNYPPFSFWQSSQVGEYLETLNEPPAPGTPLGLYLHIPFCRKRCHFCYFKVYTDKNASEIKTYLDTMKREFELYAQRPFIGDRKPKFVYFGGGTPSYLSPKQLHSLVGDLKRRLPWDEAEEVAFECEPGTLNEAKLRAIREIGVTRLSLGVEHFDDEILKLNNRAHESREIMRAYEYARSVDFPQINIDLIAGMLGETEEKWRDCVRSAVALRPDCVTIYQMEIPFNTTIFRQMKAEGRLTAPVADWPTKRRWVGEAFAAFEAAGYTVTSGYTAVRDPARTRFVYRDSLWSGADMLSLGVSSFGHVRGVHYQNEKDFGPYLESLESGRLPIRRAYRMNDEEKLVREFILQLKLGRVVNRRFVERFGVDAFERFREPMAELTQGGLLTIAEGEARLSREGLMRVDTLLHRFFLPRHREAD